MDLYLGQVILFAGKKLPPGWALCNGQLLKTADYPELYQIISNGNSGSENSFFALPEMKAPMAHMQYIICIKGQFPLMQDDKMNYKTVNKEIYQPMLGYRAQVILFAGKLVPENWMACMGQQLFISSNTGLFSLLGTVYGGDGEINFALPNLKGIAPLGMQYIICTEGIYPSRG